MKNFTNKINEKIRKRIEFCEIIRYNIGHFFYIFLIYEKYYRRKINENENENKKENRRIYV